MNKYFENSLKGHIDKDQNLENILSKEMKYIISHLDKSNKQSEK